MYEALVQIDHRLVGWSWGLWDWNWFRPREAESLARRLAKTRIARRHRRDARRPSRDPAADRRYAVEATRQLVPALERKGFAFGTLCG